jgi:hypothetical protein
MTFVIKCDYFSTVSRFKYCFFPFLQPCERVVLDNNNGASRACGGCEPHDDHCSRCETRPSRDQCSTADSCSNCDSIPRVEHCQGCGRLEPCDECAPRARSDPCGPLLEEHCAGCGRRIKDRFFLQAVERRWHEPCLRCCECQLALDSEGTCFAKDGNIFCKKDYYK